MTVGSVELSKDVRELPPVNYVIQRSARAQPIVVHADKLKKCYSKTPSSWLTEVTSAQVQDHSTNSLTPDASYPAVSCIPACSYRRTSNIDPPKQDATCTSGSGRTRHQGTTEDIHSQTLLADDSDSTVVKQAEGRPRRTSRTPPYLKYYVRGTIACNHVQYGCRLL